jgi:hypothetical protein
MLKPGDKVKFKPISIKELRVVEEAISKGAYSPFSEE